MMRNKTGEKIMFTFAPPAKVARTQRSSVSQASMQQEAIPDRGGSAVGAPYSSQTQRTVEFTDVSLRLQQKSHFISPSVPLHRPHRTLSGVGNRIAWQVVPSSAEVRLWGISSVGVIQQQPSLHRLPADLASTISGTADSVAFTAEWEEEETILMCSAQGAVRSLDGRVEFQFSSDDVAIEVSAFTVLGGVDGSCLVVAGTLGGLVLSYNIRSSEEDAGVLDTRKYLDAPDALASATSSGWLSWLTGGARRSSTTTQRQRSNRPSVIEHLVASPAVQSQLWVVLGHHHVLLVDFSEGASLQIICAIDIQGAIGAEGVVQSIEGTREGALCVYRYNDTRTEREALALVTISARTGSVASVTALSGLGMLLSFARGGGGEGATLVAMASKEHQGRDVIVVYGAALIRVNNAAGVRHPCTSDDVAVLQNAHNGTPVLPERIAAVSIHKADRIVLLDAFTGPFIAVPDTTSRTTATYHPSLGTAGSNAMSSPTNSNPSHDGSLVPSAVHIAQRVAGILSAARVDARAPIDETVMNAVDEILQGAPLHVANWARVDLHCEDVNLFTHVTRSLILRQQEHSDFIRELFTRHHDDTWVRLSTTVVASLLSVQEQLQCLVAIRSLQNDLSIGEDSVDLSRRLTVVGLQLSGDLNSTTVTAPPQQSLSPSIIASAANEHCQELLRRAVVDVADIIRASGNDLTIPKTATSAEITFGKPENICALLRRLNTIVSDTWIIRGTTGGGGNEQGAAAFASDVEGRVRLTLASAFIFSSVLDQIFTGRGQTRNIRRCNNRGGASQRMQREDVEEIERDEDDGDSGRQLAPMLTPSVIGAVLQSLSTEEGASRPMLWTASGDPQCGLEPCLLDQVMLLSDALAALNSQAWTSNLAANAAGAHRLALPALQNAVLDMLLTMIDGLMNFFSGNKAFCSNLTRRALLRPPFVAHSEGYPFGSPTAVDNVIPGCSAQCRRSVLCAAEALALHHRLFDVMFLFAAGDYHPDPESNPGHFSLLSKYTSAVAEEATSGGVSEFIPYCVEALVSQDREAEVLALPALLADPSSSSIGGVGSDIATLRDDLLRQYYPHLNWQADPTALYSLREEGAQGNPNVKYGTSAVDHRSRSLSMAKLSWIANGAPMVSHYEDVSTDELIVRAQRELLMSPNGATSADHVLSATDAVQQLLASASSSHQAAAREGHEWELAALVASRTPLPLRGELCALVLKDALARDRIASLLAISTESVSERELIMRFDKTFTGRVLIASPTLRTDYAELDNTIRRSFSMMGSDDASRDGEGRLSKILMDWLSLRATSS